MLPFLYFGSLLVALRGFETSYFSRLFVVCISRKSFLNKGLEYGRLCFVAVVELLGSSSRVVSIYA